MSRQESTEPWLTDRARARWTSVVLFGGLLFAALVELPPSETFTLCPIRMWTGIRCPGCGVGESVLELARGRVGGALRAHPMGPIVFAFLLYHAMANLLLGFVDYRPRLLRSERLRFVLSWSAAAGFLLVFCARGMVALFAH